MVRIVTSISVLESLKDEALKAAKNGEYPGANSFSAIVEIALDNLLHPDKDTQPDEAENVELEVTA